MKSCNHSTVQSGTKCLTDRGVSFWSYLFFIFYISSVSEFTFLERIKRSIFFINYVLLILLINSVSMFNNFHLWQNKCIYLLYLCPFFPGNKYLLANCGVLALTTDSKNVPFFKIHAIYKTLVMCNLNL